MSAHPPPAAATRPETRTIASGRETAQVFRNPAIRIVNIASLTDKEGPQRPRLLGLEGRRGRLHQGAGQGTRRHRLDRQQPGPSRAKECPALVAWLCSPECSFSTGAAFDLSGGRAVY